jgi:hypothetical protein
MPSAVAFDSLLAYLLLLFSAENFLDSCGIIGIKSSLCLDEPCCHCPNRLFDSLQPQISSSLIVKKFLDLLVTHGHNFPYRRSQLGLNCNDNNQEDRAKPSDSKDHGSAQKPDFHSEAYRASYVLDDRRDRDSSAKDQFPARPHPYPELLPLRSVVAPTTSAAWGFLPHLQFSLGDRRHLVEHPHRRR